MYKRQEFDCSCIFVDKETYLKHKKELKDLNYVLINDGNILKYKYQDNNIWGDLPDVAAIIFCTSGSTGKPKGVVLTNKNLLSNINSIPDYLGICENDKILLVKNMSHVSSINGELLVGLINCIEVDIFHRMPISRLILNYILENRCV